MNSEFQASLLSYIEDERVVIPKGVHLKPDMIRRVLEAEKTDLRRTLFALLIKLLKEYNYEEQQVELDVAFDGNVRADMAIYRDQKHKDPFIAVLFDSVLDNETFNKAKRIASHAKIEYLILGDLENIKIFRVYGENLSKTQDIPYWVDDKPLSSKVQKSKILPSFRNEFMLKRVIHRCHTIIYENLGHDPSKAFDEFTKIIFLKLYDEHNAKEEFYRFAAYEDERPDEVKRRISQLLEEAVSFPTFRQIFNSSSVNIELNDFSIYQVVLELQGFSFTETMETIEGIDIMGRIYEQIVGRTFRGGLGQYYTPRTIAEFMVDLLKVSIKDNVLDPACGSGGFLTMCINQILKKDKEQNQDLEFKTNEMPDFVRSYVDSKLYGIDIYDRICRVARMNLIFHGGSNPKVFNTNGLLTDEHLSDEIRFLFRDDSFQIVLSNPPFAGLVKDHKILERFELGKPDGKVKSATPEILFIEKIIDFLDNGGKAGLVLPLGIFNNPSLSFVRDFLRKKTRIIGVVGLPDYAFTHTGTSVKGALLFIEKARTPSEDYDIFMAVASAIGYDSTGRPTTKNDLPKLVEAYEKHDPEYFIRLSEVKDRIDPGYFLPSYKRFQKEVEASRYAKHSIFNLVKMSEQRINPKKYPDNVFRYLETGGVDLRQGKIRKIREFRGRKAPSRAKYVGLKGDILIPTARESLVGVLLLPENCDGVVISSRFIVCRPKEELVRPHYLLSILRTTLVLELLKRECVGEIVPSISESSLKNVFVPVPPLDVQDQMIQRIGELRKKEIEFKQELLKLREKIKTVVETTVFEKTS